MFPSDNVRMIGPLERTLFLKSLGPLEVLAAEDIAVFAENARERSFREGERIFTPGEPAPAYYAIVEGSVRVSGGEYMDGVQLGTRDSLGFLSMLARRPEGLDAVALEDVVTLEFEEDVFLDILEDRFSIVDHLVRRLAKRTLEFRQQIPDGTYLSPYGDDYRFHGGPVDLVERLRFLSRPGSPFENSSLEAMARLAEKTPEVRFDAGHTLWSSGDRAGYALILIDGTVECTTQWGFSKFRAGPGYPLGNLERFSGDPRWFTAVTETPIVALYGDTESLLDIMEDHTDLALGLARAMALRVIDIQAEHLAAEQAARESESAA